MPLPLRAMDMLYDGALQAAPAGAFTDPDFDDEFDHAKHTANVLVGALFVMTDDLFQSLLKRLGGTTGPNLSDGSELCGRHYREIASAANNFRHHSEWRYDAVESESIDGIVAEDPNDVFLVNFRNNDPCFHGFAENIVERRLRQIRSIGILNVDRDNYHAITNIVTKRVHNRLAEIGYSHPSKLDTAQEKSLP